MSTMLQPVESPQRPLSIMTAATSASTQDKTGVTWSKDVSEDNAWDELILTLGKSPFAFSLFFEKLFRRCPGKRGGFPRCGRRQQGCAGLGERAPSSPAVTSQSLDWQKARLSCGRCNQKKDVVGRPDSKHRARANPHFSLHRIILSGQLVQGPALHEALFQDSVDRNTSVSSSIGG